MDSIVSQAPHTQGNPDHDLLRQCAIDAIRAAADALDRHFKALDEVIRASAYDPNARPWGLSQRQLADVSPYCRPRVKRVLEAVPATPDET